MNRALADTGPLVAILSPADQFHDVCVEALKLLAPPLYTCWPVLTEAAWLLRRDPKTVEALLRGAKAGFFKILELEDDDAEEIAAVMKRYRDLRGTCKTRYANRNQNCRSAKNQVSRR
jgi:uncharacterized protein